MPDALHLLVYVLAVARVVRLVTSDRLTEAPRERVLAWAWARAWVPWARLTFQHQGRANVQQHAAVQARRVRAEGGEPPLLAYLVTCPWCVSVWLGAVAAPLVWFWGSSPWLAIPALALACSHVVGILATKGE